MGVYTGSAVDAPAGAVTVTLLPPRVRCPHREAQERVDHEAPFDECALRQQHLVLLPQ